MELKYYLTDHLSYFVCNEMPDHSTAKHILIPTVRVSNSKQEEALKNVWFLFINNQSWKIIFELLRLIPLRLFESVKKYISMPENDELESSFIRLLRSSNKY